MNDELLATLRDRLKEGYSEASIVEEMVSVGYTKEVAHEAYRLALSTLGGRVALPSIGEFLSTTWQLCLSQLPVFGKTILIGVGMFVFVATAIFSVMNTTGLDQKSSFIATVAVVPFIAMITAGLMSLSLTRALLKREAGELFRTHVRFVITQFFPLTLVIFYLTVLTQVGYVLFIIPGLMAAFYLIFSTFFVLVEERRGMSAVMASVRLVHGRFFSVAGRLVVLNLVLVGIVLLYALVFSVAAVGFTASSSTLGLVGFPLLFTLIIVGVVAGAYWLSVGSVVLFETLRRIPATIVLSVKAEARVKTLFYVVVGLVMIGVALMAFLLGFAGYTFVNWNW